MVCLVGIGAFLLIGNLMSNLLEVKIGQEVQSNPFALVEIAEDFRETSANQLFPGILYTYMHT